MVRLATEEEPAWEIHTSYEEDVIRLWVAEEDTVEDVKAFLASWKGEEWEVYADEMRVECQGEVVLEGVPLSAVASSPLVLSEGTAGEVVWWAQEVPQRYVIRQKGVVGSLESLESLEDLEVEPVGGGSRGSGNVILDLRFLSCDPRRIRSWLYQARDITEIWILGTHPEVVEILYAVAEDVRCLPRLQRIHLQHPSDAGFLLPPRSGRRMKRFGGGGGGGRGSRVTSEVLSYLIQHLQMDAYRVGDEVEIWVDAGLMANGAERGSHRLLVYP